MRLKRRHSTAAVSLIVPMAFMLGGCQNMVVYFPARAPESQLESQAAELGLVAWSRPGEGRIGWRRSSPYESADRVVLFHGNAGHALHRAPFVRGFEGLRDQAWDVYLFEYPGFGSRPGRPGDGAFVESAIAAIDALVAEDPDRPVYLVGESIGTGVATQAAAARPDAVPGIMLITPFTSLIDAGRARFPGFLVEAILRDRYDNVRALEEYDGRVGVLIAGRDEVVPPELGRRLYEGYDGPKRLWVDDDAAHNTIDYSPASPWWDEIARFLRDHSR